VNPSENYLTDRQIGCLYHLVMGKTIKQTAEALKLSPRTVEHYLEAIKLKLGCRSRSDLISKALSMSVIRERI
jgi:DNA-binding CsgD family transcriptional regulator